MIPSVYFDDMIVTDDIELKTKNMVDITIENIGVSDIQFSKKVIKTGQLYGMSSGFPLANETIKIEFTGTGTKKAYISFGRINQAKCNC